jgi:threonine dehydratase
MTALSKITVEDIKAARDRLQPYLATTPLEAAPAAGEQIWLKLENANRTHSFKVRGALNAMLLLSQEARARGVVTASSGNHAQALSYAAGLLGIRARIVMPIYTARRKVENAARLGGETLLFGSNYEAAEAEALRLAREEGLVYLSAYNHPDVIAGAGTIGLEIVAALPDVQRVIVPVGGGGLISGIALAVKAFNPAIEVVGVNASTSPDMFNHYYGERRPTDHRTLADALEGAIESGSITFELTRAYVDRIVLVSEDAIARAMRFMVYQQGWVAEGGGSVGLAALLDGVLPADRQTAIVISGGNVDAAVLRAVLSAGDR